jgi:hypothetical protein
MLAVDFVELGGADVPGPGIDRPPAIGIDRLDAALAIAAASLLALLVSSSLPPKIEQPARRPSRTSRARRAGFRRRQNHFYPVLHENKLFQRLNWLGPGSTHHAPIYSAAPGLRKVFAQFKVPGHNGENRPAQGIVGGMAGFLPSKRPMTARPARARSPIASRILWRTIHRHKTLALAIDHP